MNQRYLEHVQIIAMLAALAFAFYGVVHYSPEVTANPDPCQENTIVEDMWRYESSPSDRRAILEGLSAMQCIDAGLCELAIDLPTAGSHNEP